MHVSKQFQFLAIMLLSMASSIPAQAQETASLELGKAIERELSGGQTHAYSFALAAGQFARVIVEQKGIDVVVRLLDANGNSLAEVDSPNDDRGEEVLFWATPTTAPLRLAIKSLDEKAKPGKYRLEWKEMRATTAEDQSRLTAQKHVQRGRELRNQAETFRQALTEFEAATKLWEAAGEKKWLAYTQFFLAVTNTVHAQWNEAVRWFQIAGATFQSVGDAAGEASVLNNWGTAYFYLNDNKRALELLQRAWPLKRAVGDRLGEAWVLDNLAYAYRVLGEPQQAIVHSNLALPLFRAGGERKGEAMTLENLGGIYAALGEKQKALEAYESAWAVWKTLTDPRGEGTVLKGIGAVYDELGESQKAVEYYLQALPLARTAQDKNLEAALLHNLGVAYDLLGERARALEYFGQALPLWRTLEFRSGEASTILGVGRVQFAQGEHQKALASMQQALTLKRTLEDRASEAYILNFLGEVYFALSEPEQALASCYQALLLNRTINLRDNEAATLGNLMLFWQARTQPSLAIYYGKQSVNQYQELRANIHGLSQETQRAFLKSKEKTYRELADLLITQGRLPEAEQVIRMLKEEEYFEYVRRDGKNGAKTEKAALTPEEAALDKRYQEIADQLTGLGAERSTLLGKTARTAEEEKRLEKLEADLVVASQVFQKFFTQLSTELGQQKRTDSQLASVQQSQAFMEDLRELGAGTVALYTVVSEDKFHVILTTSDVRKSYSYTIKAAALNRKVLDFRAALQNPKLDPLPLAQELYKILVAPLAKDLRAAKAETLMWSLDGVLRYMPIAALHDGEKYLVERWRNVVFTPASKARLKDEPSRNWNALGLGVTKSFGEKIPALPGVAEEMRGIIKEAGSATGVLPGTIKLDEQFTQESMLTGLRRRPPVVHVASHFQFQPGNETNSALLLGDGKMLSLAVIKSLPNVFGGVELLTLSACNTATGGSGADGKEVEGFGMLAQDQGAKAVIASLWPVADRSTKHLMQEFYRLREAKNNSTKAEAMRQAQIKLLRGELQVTGAALAAREILHNTDKTANQPLFKIDPKAPYAHPYYWAPFILIGNWK